MIANAVCSGLLPEIAFSVANSWAISLKILCLHYKLYLVFVKVSYTKHFYFFLNNLNKFKFGYFACKTPLSNLFWEFRIQTRVKKIKNLFSSCIRSHKSAQRSKAFFQSYFNGKNLITPKYILIENTYCFYERDYFSFCSTHSLTILSVLLSLLIFNLPIHKLLLINWLVHYAFVCTKYDQELT